MTQLTIKNKIDDSQLYVLLYLLKSWNLDAEVSNENNTVPKKQHKLFSKTRGMWKDYDIDAKQLRREAWGTDKHTLNIKDFIFIPGIRLYKDKIH
jgi:hypothetical protein